MCRRHRPRPAYESICGSVCCLVETRRPRQAPLLTQARARSRGRYDVVLHETLHMIRSTRYSSINITYFRSKRKSLNTVSCNMLVQFVTSRVSQNEVLTHIKGSSRTGFQRVSREKSRVAHQKQMSKIPTQDYARRVARAAGKNHLPRIYRLRSEEVLFGTNSLPEALGSES